jgi:hypothetical protein
MRVIPDGAGYVDTNRVGHTEISFPKLLEMVVVVAGLDPARIGTILRAGTVTLGANRYRWPPITLETTEIAPLLEPFPKADPSRPFEASRCLLARIRAGVETIELPREMASRRRGKQVATFWDVLIAVAAAHTPQYSSYSYRESADLYTLELSPDEEKHLRQAAPLLVLDRTAEQITGLPLERITFYVKR